MATPRPNPYSNFNFIVEADGIGPLGAFSEVTGLDSENTPIEYREGADPNHVRKIPGLNTYTAITLKRGITDSDELWKWRETVINGKTERRNGSIVLLDETGAEKIRWNFSNAWPSKWTGPALNATSTAVAVETLEITHEEVKRA